MTLTKATIADHMFQKVGVNPVLICHEVLKTWPEN